MKIICGRQINVDPPAYAEALGTVNSTGGHMHKRVNSFETCCLISGGGTPQMS